LHELIGISKGQDSWRNITIHNACPAASYAYGDTTYGMRVNANINKRKKEKKEEAPHEFALSRGSVANFVNSSTMKASLIPFINSPYNQSLTSFSSFFSQLQYHPYPYDSCYNNPHPLNIAENL